MDIDRGNAFVERIKPLVAATHKRGVLSDLGGFSGLFSLSGEHVNNPVLVSSTDGVGTKLAVAKLMNRHDTIGIDCPAVGLLHGQADEAAPGPARPAHRLDETA